LKLKLDENLSRHLKAEIEGLGHEPRTAAEQGLLGKRDPEVAAAAKSEGEIILTLDLEFGDLRKYPPGSHPGIILFRPRSMGPRFVGGVVMDFLKRTQLAELAGCLVVVDPDRVRVRYPPLDTDGDEWTDVPS
jgi:predicted nuclease of predicted toxin-antitoxin system